YGYDWEIGGTGSAEVTFGQTVSAAVTHNAPIKWDDDTGNLVLRYQAAGRSHEVWFLDAVTGLNEVRWTATAGFRGVGLWRLGAEDPDLWTAMTPESWPREDYDPKQLSVLTAQKSAIHYGDGDVLRIVQTPHDGRRQVTRDSDGDYSETYQALPS